MSDKSIIFLTKMNITQSVLDRIANISLNRPFHTTQFLDLGERAAIDQALSRLVKRGLICRVTRGIFIRTESGKTPEIAGELIRKVVKTIAEVKGFQLHVNGAQAAKLLGLTKRVKNDLTFLIDGRSRILRIGSRVIRLKQISQRKINFSMNKPSLALSALWFFGRKRVTQRIIAHIYQEFSANELEVFKHLRSRMASWMCDALLRYEKSISHSGRSDFALDSYQGN